jgi:hypothetical protein
VTSTNLQTEFLLQFRKQQEDSAILLASNKPQHKDRTKNRPTEMEKQNFRGKGTAGTDKEQVGLQEAPHLQDSQNHSENSKSRSSKEEFFFIKQPSSSL